MYVVLQVFLKYLLGRHCKLANAVLPRIPARRWGDRSDFEAIAVYLMSDASSYHTGDSLLIDGGFFIN